MARYKCLEWLMFQMGGVGPMFGQYGHFHNYAPDKLEYAMNRYANEVKRLHGVLDRRLAQAEWLAGDEYSIADIITYPWLRFPERRGIDFGDYPNVKRWFAAVDGRPAVRRGVAVLAEHVRQGPMDEKQKEILFGKTQFERR
jgi:GST-like protein